MSRPHSGGDIIKKNTTQKTKKKSKLDPVGKVANKIDKLAYYSVETVTIKNLNYSILKYK
jgi:hypothetical protein